MTISKNYEEQSVVFGIHPVMELLKAKRRQVRRVYTTQPTPKIWGSVSPLLPARVPIQYVTRDKLTMLAGSADHQGIVVYAGLFPYRKKMFEPKKSPFLIMLDGVQDPRNLGAIIRSAYCTGVNGVIICRKQGAPLQGIALKASVGLAERMEIYEAPSAIAAIQEIKKAGYAIYLAALGGKDARSVVFNEPLCVVIGSEGVGISPAVLAYGTSVMLAQKANDVSYNASVAAGILLFTIAIAKNKI